MILPSLPDLQLNSLLRLDILQNLTVLTPLRMRCLSLLDPALVPAHALSCSCLVPAGCLLTDGTSGSEEVTHQYFLQWEMPQMRDRSNVCFVAQSRMPWDPNSQGAVILNLHVVKLAFMREAGIQVCES